jgi:hypothetical protein
MHPIRRGLGGIDVLVRRGVEFEHCVVEVGGCARVGEGTLEDEVQVAEDAGLDGVEGEGGVAVGD